jgi:hypothetical protein
MKEDTDREVTLENLLRLKRSERPPAEFWAHFDAELRAKQLSAIVSKRPWWDRFSRTFAVVGRYQLPVGAAAALAMAFAGYRYLEGQGELTAVSPQAPAPQGSTVAAAPAAPARAAAALVGATSLRREVALSGARGAAPAPKPVVDATASHMTQAPVEVASDSLTKSPFADGIAIKLADFREPLADYARPSVFGSDREFEQPAAARQAVSDPLARMDPAAERRARLLAPALPAYSSRSPISVPSDWMRQRSSADDRMYESMDRGTADDRMLVGFRF